MLIDERSTCLASETYVYHVSNSPSVSLTLTFLTVPQQLPQRTGRIFVCDLMMSSRLFGHQLAYAPCIALSLGDRSACYLRFLFLVLDIFADVWFHFWFFQRVVSKRAKPYMHNKHRNSYIMFCLHNSKPLFPHV